MTARRSRVRRAAEALLLIGLFSACTATQRMTASRSDYALYREARLAETLLERLAKSHRYLHEEPDGRFRAEVQRWVAELEPRFDRVARDRPSLLRAYLRLAPDAPHAKVVQGRLVELDLLREYRRKEQLREAERARRIEAELVNAQLARRAFVARIGAITKQLVAIRSFGAPVADLDDALEQELAIGGGGPRCDADRCSRYFSLSFAVPEQRKIVARSAPLELVIQLKQGRVRRASFGGELLFSRFAEAIDLTPVAAGDLRARVEAIGRSAQIFANVLEPVLPATECARDAVSPRILVRECRGVRVELRAGLYPGDPDRVEVSAAASVPAPSRAAGQR